MKQVTGLGLLEWKLKLVTEEGYLLLKQVSELVTEGATEASEGF